jgi:hypothetical protein
VSRSLHSAALSNILSNVYWPCSGALLWRFAKTGSRTFSSVPCVVASFALLSTFVFVFDPCSRREVPTCGRQDHRENEIVPREFGLEILIFAPTRTRQLIGVPVTLRWANMAPAQFTSRTLALAPKLASRLIIALTIAFMKQRRRRRRVAMIETESLSAHARPPAHHKSDRSV